jgi:hypothetical protein
MKKQLLAFGFVIAGAIFSGTAANAAVYVRVAPPAPHYGVVGVAPRHGYVWAEGCYNYRGSAYVWAPGRWMRPPRPQAAWVPGAWVQGHRGYEFHKGYWR